MNMCFFNRPDTTQRAIHCPWCQSECHFHWSYANRCWSLPNSARYRWNSSTICSLHRPDLGNSVKYTNGNYIPKLSSRQCRVPWARPNFWSHQLSSVFLPSSDYQSDPLWDDLKSPLSLLMNPTFHFAGLGLKINIRKNLVRLRYYPPIPPSYLNPY